VRGENRQPQPLFKSLLPGFIFAITLLSSVVPARAAEDLSATLQRGLFEEEANNNLPAAIKAYEAVISATDAQRKLAGTALFRLAECQRKLGRTNDAVALYQRVLREYPDQTRLADLSRQYVVTTAPAELGSDLGTERARLLEREFVSQQVDYGRLVALYRSLTNLSRPELKKIIPTAAPDPLLNSLQEQRLKAEQRLMELAVSRDANGKTLTSEHPDMKAAMISLETIDKQIEGRLDGIVAGIAVKVASLKASLDEATKTLEQTRTGTGTSALSQAARAEQKRLLGEEIKIVEKDLADLEQQRKTGVVSAGALSAKQRELLALRRHVAALGVETVDEGSRLAVSTPTDEEDKEVRRIQALIKDSPDLINAGDGNGATPLHKAAVKGQLVVAKFLLANKANVNARRQYNISPLHEAVMNGHKSMTELLLANGAEVEASASPEGTPLHCAANRGYRSIAEVLLANKANPNVLNVNQATPLHNAVKKGFKSVAELLLEAGADVNLVENNASMTGDPNQYSHDVGTPLHIAVYTGNKALVEMLLAHRPDVNLRNQFGEAPLHLLGNNVELAKLLIAAQADVNARMGELGNDLGMTPLCVAVTRGHADMVEFLLKNGADPNVRFRYRNDSSEHTPLTAAVYNNDKPNARIIEALLVHKADTRASNYLGLPPLHLSVHKANKVAVELLLKHGADVEIRDREGNTPLCLMSGGKEIIQLLLDHKANPNAQNNAGNTPLHTAVNRTVGNNASSQKEAAELLINRGADVNIRNREGLTPLNLYGVPARTGSAYATELAEILRKHGAKDEQLELAADPDSIRVWRKGMTHGRVVFVRDAAGNNRFTLIEALLNIYNLRQTPATVTQKPPAPTRPLRTPRPNNPPPALQPTSGALQLPVAVWTGEASEANPSFTVGQLAYGGSPPPNYDPVNEFAFPDLTRIRVLRQVDAAKDEKKVISVNLLNAAGIVLCNNDVLLEFGDIVEIPEREYRLDESRVGLTSEQSKGFFECLPKNIEVVVKGRSSPVKLAPIPSTSYVASVMRMSSVRNVLRSTSDLSRLRITRRADPAIEQKAQELTVDLEAFQRSGKQHWDDLWLRDGDIIEVPERE
jgi:ankyrin repeat protein